jgi:hypothetical protein
MYHPPIRPYLGFAGCICILLVACAPGGTGERRIDSNTNWLVTCLSNADCEAGEACLCGGCTAPCANQAACDALGAGACAQRGDAAWAAQCGENTNAPAGLCLPACGEGVECPSGSSCLDGICAPDETPTQPDDCAPDGDAGAPDAGIVDVVELDSGNPPVGCDPEQPVVCGLAIGEAPASVYECQDGEYTFADLCPTACAAVPDRNDVCDSGAGCFEGDGFYCGEAFDLPPGVLFHCSGAGIFVAAPCVAGCQIVPGGPDRCNAP